MRVGFWHRFRQALRHFAAQIALRVPPCSTTSLAFAKRTTASNRVRKSRQWSSIPRSLRLPHLSDSLFRCESVAMATAVTLNPEPSLTSERQKQHLPPKSYADITEENLKPQTHEYQSTPELYAGNGEEESISRSPRRNLHKKSGSTRVNGFSNDSKDAGVIIERYEDKDGEHLVSIKTASDGPQGKRRSTRRNSELVSGRKAGAGWERSGYTRLRDQMCAVQPESS